MHNIAQRADIPMRPYEDQGPTILGATLTVTIAALMTTIARLYVRFSMIRNVGWDDYVMTATMILCVVGQGIVIPQVHYGAGKHAEYIDPKDFGFAMKLNFISQPLYLFAICFVKLSIGFFLLRIAVHRFYRRLIIGIMVFMGVYSVGCFFTIVLQCTDLRLLWDPTVKGGTCWTAHTLKSLSYANQALNIFTDVAFSVAIPIPMILSIQMNRRQKASLICILGLGIFATAAAIVKLSYVSNYGKTGDWLWDSRNLTIWTVVECNCGIIAGNLPCLKPLFRTVLGSSTYGRGSRKDSHSNYISKTYGPGSHVRSITKPYSSITSDKAAGGEFGGYGSQREAYMLTTIGARKGEGSVGSSGRSSPTPGKDSSESVTRLHDKSNAMNGLGDITVTTKVDVIESAPSPGYFDHGRRRPQAKEMV